MIQFGVDCWTRVPGVSAGSIASHRHDQSGQMIDTADHAVSAIGEIKVARTVHQGGCRSSDRGLHGGAIVTRVSVRSVARDALYGRNERNGWSGSMSQKPGKRQDCSSSKRQKSMLAPWGGAIWVRLRVGEAAHDRLLF
jgi:hypothetical protein